MKVEFRTVFISGHVIGNLQLQEDITKQCSEAGLRPVFLPEGSSVQVDNRVVTIEYPDYDAEQTGLGTGKE